MAKKTLLFFVFVGFMCVPNLVLADDDQGGDINQRSADGKKQGLWVYFGKDRPELGFPADGKIEEGPYKDDRKEGMWTRYHNDGVTPRLIGEYHNNRPNGEYTKIYPDGTTKEVGVFNRNKYAGTLERYHPNGQLKYKSDYNDDGKEEGTVKYLYANGQEEFVYESRDGVPTGKATRYYENGDIKEVITFGADGKVITSEPMDMVNSEVTVVDPGASKEKAPKIVQPRTKGAAFKPNAYNKVYNMADEIWQDGDFRNGELWDGKVYEYDSDGILLKVKVFKEGVYHSDGQL
ncbi:MAG: hypothetical protein JKY09_09095 [Crocinitomicaceae bacterium]|nr:hypothetical protein [Crocinitomicaceae bacterium]